MKMPKGFDKLFEIRQRSKSQKDRKILDMSIQMHYEMAIALEQEIKHLHSEGYGYDSTKRSREVLKKFKEWR